MDLQQFRRSLNIKLKNHFRGALLGTMVGAPLEGLISRMMEQSKHGLVTKMIESRLGIGRYTDDTQMAIGLAEALVDANLT